jgi:tripartite-type tricarboxylate transporter receptor subunit TctC
MTSPRARLFGAWAGAALGMALSSVAALANAQAWPAKPVRLVIPTSPGSSMDTIARMVSQKMSETVGQAVVPENQAGAQGRIGAERVARAAPDGYTLMIMSPSTTVVPSLLSKSWALDSKKEFTPITAAADPVSSLVIHPSLPVNTVQELVAYMKQHPNKVAFGSSGIAGIFHLLGELFKREVGVEYVHVPYKGVAPAVAATLTGEVQMTFSAVNNIIAHQRTGKLKVLAITQKERYRDYPDVPAITEIYPRLDRPASWFGFFGPGNLPQPVLTRIHAELVKALQLPDIRGKIEAGGMVLVANSPAEFHRMYLDAFRVYERVIKEAGIQPE